MATKSRSYQLNEALFNLISGVEPEKLEQWEINALSEEYGPDWIESTLDINDDYRADAAYKKYLNGELTGEN